MGKSADRSRQFEEYFAGVYGTRWPALRQALLVAPEKRALENPFGLQYQAYSLDPASLYPVQALEARASENLADFCASPGGKLLASIFALRGEARWTCNDLSAPRVQRLKAVLHDCLPPEIFARVQVERGDASRWGQRRAGEFDRILVDAPCSGERHLLADARELARWSLKGCKGLAIRQNSLLCAALDCVKPGGRVVYSTCSINPLENDGVIARLKKSREGAFRVLDARAACGDAAPENTESGAILLPDRAGCGPIYFSVIEKT